MRSEEVMLKKCEHTVLDTALETHSHTSQESAYAKMLFESPDILIYSCAWVG